MDKWLRTAGILLGLLLLAPGGFSQDTVQDLVQDEVQDEEPAGWEDQSGTIPDILRRPDRGEAPRYPRDVVIGELGQGNSPNPAYRFAGDLLSALTAGNRTAQIVKDSLSILTEELFNEIESIRVRSYRIGGGRVETDGSVSFLVRFLGSEESITGELFVRQEADPGNDEAPSEGKWLLDDLILEEKKDLTDIRDSYRYDFSPYERFY